jgi:hypothetical protein
MRRLILLCTLLPVLLLGAPLLRAQPTGQSGNQGREFLLSFPANWDYAASFKYVRFYITAPTVTKVRVYSGDLLVRSVTTKIHELVTVDLPLSMAEAVSRDDQSPVPNDTIYRNRAVRVVADDPIVLYAINRITYTSDGILALPTSALGRDYVVASAPDIADGGIQRLPSQYVIVAPYDNTVVTIVNAFDTPNHRAGQALTVMMQKGDVYSAMSSGAMGDLTGTRITSTLPVAVLSGSNCTYLPNAQYPACDHIVEMLPPISTWGKVYNLVPFASRLKGDLIRVFAGEPDATISINGIPVARLNNVGGPEGLGWLQILPPQRELMQITSDKKIFVAQYNNSQTYDGVQADPFMLGLMPTDLYVTEALFTTPQDDYAQNFVNLVVDSAGWTDIEISRGAAGDWKKLSTLTGATPKSYPQLIDGVRYQGISFQIDPGTYRLRGERPFGGLLYGWTSFDSYGYPMAVAYPQTAEAATYLQAGDAEFGTVLIDAPAERDVIIRNRATNDRALTITGASGPHSSVFRVIAGMPAFPFVLQPGESDTIRVRFDPDEEVLYRDTIFFEHDAPAGSINDNMAILNGNGTNTVAVPEEPALFAISLGPVTPTPVDGERGAIGYSIAEPATVEITLVDIAGRTVRTLLERSRLESGGHTLGFDVSTLAPGTYYCRMSVGARVLSCPVVIRR